MFARFVDRRSARIELMTADILDKDIRVDIVDRAFEVGFEVAGIRFAVASRASFKKKIRG